MCRVRQPWALLRRTPSECPDRRRSASSMNWWSVCNYCVTLSPCHLVTRIAANSVHSSSSAAVVADLYSGVDPFYFLPDQAMVTPTLTDRRCCLSYLFLVLPASMLSGCTAIQTHQKVAEQLAIGPEAPVTREQSVEEAYRVGFPDVLQISVPGRPDCSGIFPISAEGCVEIATLGNPRIEGETIRGVWRSWGIWLDFDRARCGARFGSMAVRSFTCTDRSTAPSAKLPIAVPRRGFPASAHRRSSARRKTERSARCSRQSRSRTGTSSF